MKELNDIENLIIKSLDKTASEAELKVLKEWINQSESNKRHYFQFKDVWDSTKEVSMPKVDSAWRDFKRQTQTTRSITKWGKELIKIAAIAITVAIASYFVFQLPDNIEESTAFAKVVVPNGSKTTVHLADGTIVRLNAGSELIYPTQFNKELRTVELRGEGYFEVQHNAEHPFQVTAGEIEVRVLGTEFNVMAYPDADRIETTLVEGSISLNKRGTSATKAIILKPGEKAIYKEGELNVNDTDITLATNWMQKGFHFKSTPFKEMVVRLERWYDVDIVYNPVGFEDLTFTGKFRNNETIWQVLDVIKMTTPINYKAKDGKIYINLINE